MRNSHVTVTQYYNRFQPPLRLAYRSCGSKVIREIIAREEPGNEATQTSMQVNQAQTLPLGAGTRRWIVVEIFFSYMYAAMSILGAARQIISRLGRSYFDVTK